MLLLLVPHLLQGAEGLLGWRQRLLLLLLRGGLANGLAQQREW